MDGEEHSFQAQRDNIKNLSSMLFELEHRVASSEERLIRHDEKLQKLQSGQDKLSNLLRRIEDKLSTFSSELLIIQKDFTTSISEIHRLKLALDNLQALLQSHAQKETEQYSEYMAAIAKNASIVANNTTTLENLNKNFIKLIVVAALLVVFLSLFISKFDLITKFGLFGGL